VSDEISKQNNNKNSGRKHAYIYRGVRRATVERNFKGEEGSIAWLFYH